MTKMPTSTRPGKCNSNLLFGGLLKRSRVLSAITLVGTGPQSSIGSHSFYLPSDLPQLQPKLVLDLSTPDRLKAEFT